MRIAAEVAMSPQQPVAQVQLTDDEYERARTQNGIAPDQAVYAWQLVRIVERLRFLRRRRALRRRVVV